MLGAIARIVTRVILPALPVLGGLGKGKATAVGTVGAAIGTALYAAAPLLGKVPLIGGVVTADNVVPLVHELAAVLIALFAMIGAFGAGRKAGATPEYQGGK